jgi:anti-sigma factor (TIGR02949 family)
MSCREWHDRLQAYVDAELPPHEMEAFRVHAAHCPDCASAALSLIEAKTALRRAGRRYEASPDLRGRVIATIRDAAADQATGKPPSRSSNVISWPRWAVAAAAVLLLAAGLFFFANRNRRPNSLAEFADLHVATLASANPVDVVSTDRHTVKPWFQGRIPFSFDLPELQGTPFVLTGGRVTYFHQEPGAQLIFGYQKHFISAFILRDTPQLDIAQASFTDRGTSFNLYTWTRDGLRYVLVSDVNSATLQELSALLQHR